MIKNLFLTTLEASVTVSVVTLLLRLLSPLLSRRYAARWKYLVWISLALRLIIPLNRNLIPRHFVISIPSQTTAPLALNPGAGIPIQLQTVHHPAGLTLLDVAIVIWIGGALLFFLLHLCSYLHYKRQLIALGKPIQNTYILRLLSCLSEELHVKRSISAMTYREAESPMVIGFFKPILVLPENQYDREELFFILKHELIHLKRHDVSFKLLFLAANALHWFNPVIYLMQKQAALDMELSCDERVIRGTSYDSRRAYTETLLSTLHRQCKKASLLSTQFCGGTKIMKKRFINILSKSKKRNGFLLLTCITAFTLSLSMLVGCSLPDSGPTSAASSAPQDDADTQLFDPPASQSPAAPEPSPAENAEATPSRDEAEAAAEETLLSLLAETQEICDTVESFTAAYFSGDVNGIQNYLTTPFEWDITVYEGNGATVCDTTLKGLPEKDIETLGSACVLSLEFRSSAESDSFLYLTIEMVKQSDEWKIQSYGLEG